MAYIGNSPANVGNYQQVDDISGSFDGSLVTFNLLVASAAISPAKDGQLLVSVNGVMQEPDSTGTNGFKVSGSTIVFSSAPASSSTFWAIYQGQNVDVGTPSDGTVGTDQLSATGVSATKFLRGDNTWVVPTDTNTVYTHPTGAGNEHLPSAVSQTEAGYLNGVTSDIQTQLDAKLPTAGGTMTGTTVLKGITETQVTKSASFTPVFADGTVYSCTGTMTITMPTATAGKNFTVIHATATSITWVGTIKWNGGSAPSAGSGIDIYVFASDGTNWYGMQSGTGFA
jgi:hypothetical protein